jgi:uncharacterized protein YecE (DUF72 family)
VRGVIRIGCSGWAYAHWREPVYEGAPASSWLARYAELFDTVEINATFYRLPTTRAAAGWAERTPERFVFAVKVSRYLTHVRRLEGVEDGMRRLGERIAPIAERGKLGPLLWQLPETFHRDDARLAGALAALPDGRHAFEFRHPSWFVPDVARLLRRHGVALVVGDHPSRAFQSAERTADFSYVRFHHGHRGRGGNYSDAELREWAGRIAAWARAGDVFAYFNNDWNAYAPRNAARLRRLLER